MYFEVINFHPPLAWVHSGATPSGPVLLVLTLPLDSRQKRTTLTQDSLVSVKHSVYVASFNLQNNPVSKYCEALNPGGLTKSTFSKLSGSQRHLSLLVPRRKKTLKEVSSQEDANSALAKSRWSIQGAALSILGMVPFGIMGRIHRKVVAGSRKTRARCSAFHVRDLRLGGPGRQRPRAALESFETSKASAGWALQPVQASH